jgi:hypothetical protein
MDFNLEFEVERLAVSENNVHLKKLLDLQNAFPDLRMEFDPHGYKKLWSKKANSLVDKFELEEIKGEVLVWCYGDLNEGKVYSDPAFFILGKANGLGFGLTPKEGWEADLWIKGIGQDLIDKITVYVNNHPVISYKE